jgi:HSP20 family protein
MHTKALVSRKPWGVSFDAFPADVQHVFNSFFNDDFFTGLERFPTANQSNVKSFIPAIDIAEDKEKFLLHVAVPGMKKEDFRIEVKDNRLTISGERQWKEEQMDRNWTRVESSYGRFSRTLTLPETVKRDGITADYQDGILNLTLPKVPVAENLQTIPVN